MMDYELDINPESNFFNNINSNCCYYSEDQFKDDVKLDNCISIIHFSSRSLYANYQNIKEYLSQFTTPFSVVAISETWLRAEKGLDFELDGYDFKYINRRGKAGGGTAIYIDNRLNYKMVESMTKAIDGVCECITIEIIMDKQKNIIVSCVYRAPSSNVDTFRETMEDLFAKSEQKVIFICGDFNINLLNPSEHSSTDECIAWVFTQ